MKYIRKVVTTFFAIVSEYINTMSNSPLRQAQCIASSPTAKAVGSSMELYALACSVMTKFIQVWGFVAFVIPNSIIDKGTCRLAGIINWF